MPILHLWTVLLSSVLTQSVLSRKRLNFQVLKGRECQGFEVWDSEGVEFQIIGCTGIHRNVISPRVFGLSH